MKQLIRQYTSTIALAMAGVLMGAVIILFAQIKQSNAAPYLGCSPNGYIVKDNGNNTDIQAIDMVTGQGSSAGTVAGHKLNAIGYNPKDNHFYAWDIQNAQYIQMDASFNVTGTWTPVQIGYADSTTDIFAGDVDEDGYHWFFRVSGGTTHWYKVDTSMATPTVVDSGSTAEPSDPPDTLSQGFDWAYIPGAGKQKLYRGMDNGTGITIVAFDRTTHAYSVVGKVTNITGGNSTDLNMGAVYADPDGNFYMSSTGTGVLWRVDLDTPSGPGTFTATQLQAADIGSNDGARCALASVPTDLGDAPSSYKTLISDDGPRHNVANYDIATHTAPLMLGKTIDIEEDGQPGPAANGDDTHDVDDENSIGTVTIGGKTSVAASIPVTVTNNTGSVATLAGWLDSGNGSFDSSERVVTAIPANSGAKKYTLTFPNVKYNGDTYIRLRVFSGTVNDPQPTGPVAGGEVEDHFIDVDPNKTGVTITDDPNGPDAPNTGFGIFQYNIWQTVMIFGLAAALLLGTARFLAAKSKV